MGNTVMNLKLRKVEGTITARMEPVAEIIRSGDKDVLFEMFSSLKSQPQFIHDQWWLELITGYVPKDGIAPRDQAPWFGLRARVGKLDTTREGRFTLNPSQSALIWKRICDPDFRVNVMSGLWSEFVVEFCRAAGTQFEGMTADLWEDLDAEPPTKVPVA